MSNRLTTLLTDNGYRYGLLLYPWQFSSATAVKCLEHPKVMIVTDQPKDYLESTCSYDDYTKILSFINGTGKRLLYVDDLPTLIEVQKSKEKPYSEYMTISENLDLQIIFSATVGVSQHHLDALMSFFPKILILSVMTDLPTPEVDPLNLQLGLTPEAVMKRFETIMKLNPPEHQSACAANLCFSNVTQEGIVGMIDKLHIVCVNNNIILTQELISLIRKCLDTSKGIRQNNLTVYIYYDKSINIESLTNSYYSTVKYFNALLDRSVRSYYDADKGCFVT